MLFILGAILISGNGKEVEFDISSNQVNTRYSAEAIENASKHLDSEIVFVQDNWFDQKIY